MQTLTITLEEKMEEKLTVFIKFDFMPPLPEEKPDNMPEDMRLIAEVSSVVRAISGCVESLASIAGIKVNTNKNRLLQKCVLKLESAQVGKRNGVTMVSEFNPSSPMLTDGTYTPIESIIIMFAQSMSLHGTLIPLGDEENEVDLSE